MAIERPKTISEQVESYLRAKIGKGDFAPGLRLPSESALAAELGVSRATVRTVLAKLEAEHLVFRRQGDGTYTNKHVMEINAHMGDEWDFKYMIQDSGRVPTIQPIRVETRHATQQELEVLEIDTGSQVLSILRLFLADAHPVIYSENIIPLNLLVEPGPYDVTQPIRQILRQYCRQEVDYTVSDISATLPAPEMMGYLTLHQDRPILKFTDVFYSERDQPLVFGLNYYNDKALRMRFARSWKQAPPVTEFLD